jgi:hypothetical protein
MDDVNDYRRILCVLWVFITFYLNISYFWCTNLVFALGLGTRFGLHAHPQSKGNYIVEYLFVVLSVGFPC